MKSLFALAAVFASASAQTSIHQLWTCTTTEDCKTYLPKDTPNTGISCDTVNNWCVCPAENTAYSALDGTNNYRQCFPLDGSGAPLLGNRRANIVFTMTSTGTNLNCAEIENFRNAFKTTFQTLVTNTVTIKDTEHFCNGATMYTAVMANVLFTDLQTATTRNAVMNVRNNIQAQLLGVLTNVGTVNTAGLNVYTEEFVRSNCRGTVVGAVLTSVPFDNTALTTCSAIQCKPGYTISSTGACVSTPAPFMIIRDPNRTPYPVPEWDNDDDMSVDAAVGLTFGVIVFVAIMVGLYMFSSAAEERHRKEEAA